MGQQLHATAACVAMGRAIAPSIKFCAGQRAYGARGIFRFSVYGDSSSIAGHAHARRRLIIDISGAKRAVSCPSPPYLVKRGILAVAKSASRVFRADFVATAGFEQRAF